MFERPKILTQEDLDAIDKLEASYKYRAEYHWINPIGGHNDSFCTTVLGYGDDKEELIKYVIENNENYEYDPARGMINYHHLEESPRKFVVIKND